MDRPAEEIARSAPRLIWDGPTRLFHWLLVVSIAASWATASLDLPLIQLPAIGGKPISLARMDVHLALGYWTLGLIIFRISWGVMGSRHARFASFLKGPATTWRYASSLFSAHHETPGHNPMGGLMVVVMIVLIARQIYSGLFAADDLLECGIYAGAWAHTLDVAGQKAMRGLHGDNFNLILIAIAAHLIAIALYRFWLKTDLVGPMLTGRKSASRVDYAAAITGTPWIRLLIAVALSAGLAWWIVTAGQHAPAVCVPADDFM
jgi:cytochrome b